MLRRPLAARLFATTFQKVLTLVALVFLVSVGGSVASGNWSMWPYLVAQAAMVALWLRGFTAWARVDDEGLHWRYWVRWDHPWPEITRVTLTRRALLATVVGNGGPPIILVRTRGDEDFIVPALACGRHRREFGTAVLAAARSRGTRTEVVSTRWNEDPTGVAAPWE